MCTTYNEFGHKVDDEGYAGNVFTVCSTLPTCALCKYLGVIRLNENVIRLFFKNGGFCGLTLKEFYERAIHNEE